MLHDEAVGWYHIQLTLKLEYGKYYKKAVLSNRHFIET